MKTENVVLMRMARESLQGKWDVAIGTIVVYLIITGVVQLIPFVGVFIGLIINGAIALGLALFSLAISRNHQPKVEQLFEGFNNFATAIVTNILLVVFTLLWTLLLIIPGIIAALSYSMTFYILADNPTIGAMEAIDLSKKMMEGNKTKLFRLGLRFFGLGLLCLLTLGIGFLWLIPFMHVTYAKFYEDIKYNV